MTTDSPNLIVLAGPNGAGKSTAAPFLLRDRLAVSEFVNADVIAQGLSGFDTSGAAIAAGRIMLGRLHDLAKRRIDFAFETTLASQGIARTVRELQRAGYRFHVVFLWLPNPDMAVARVQDRVRLGGHSVPEETIRRRYERGLRNLFRLYIPLARTWAIYDNSTPAGPRPIVRGGTETTEEVIDAETWRLIQRAGARTPAPD